MYCVIKLKKYIEDKLQRGPEKKILVLLKAVGGQIIYSLKWIEKVKLMLTL